MNAVTALMILSQALKETAKSFRYCHPQVSDWMPTLADNIDKGIAKWRKV